MFADGELVFGQLWYDGYYYGEKVKIIELNFSDSTEYRWSNCEEVQEEAQYTIVALQVPAGAPAAGVEIIGSFDGWTGTQMELLETGWYFAAIQAKPSDEFKFREAGTWENEIVYASTGYGLENIKFKDVWVDDSYKGDSCKWIELDLSGSDFAWKANWVKPEPIVTDTIQAVMAQESQTQPGNMSIIWMADSTKSALYQVYLYAADMTNYTLTPIGYYINYANVFALSGYPDYYGMSSKALLQYGTNYTTLKDNPSVSPEALAAFKEGWENNVDTSDYTLKAGYYYVIVTGYDAMWENITEEANGTLVEMVGKTEPVDPEEPVTLTIKQAENGCVKLEVNSEETYTFHIVPAEGWQIHTVMYNGMDVTSSVQDGMIQLSGITYSSELNITFSEIPTGAANVSDNKVKVYGHNENVIITNAQKNDLISIYTQNGMLVNEYIADSDRMSIKLQSGLYMVKVKGLAVKVLL